VSGSSRRLSSTQSIADHENDPDGQPLLQGFLVVPISEENDQLQYFLILDFLESIGLKFAPTVFRYQSQHSDIFVNCAAKNAADLETGSLFQSAHREHTEDILHTRNNWICYNFKERRIVPTHYTIRTDWGGKCSSHLKSWLVETSTDGENWREVAREEDNKQLNGEYFTATFPIAGGRC
jgi:hypothetical protein